MYVPVQGVGEEGIGATNGYACCTFRRSLTQLDASTGAVLWKTYTIAEPVLRGTSPAGVPHFGPAGAAIWAAPTIDPKRGLVYVGTGNGYAEPAQSGTGAIIAMDLKSGAIRWQSRFGEGSGLGGQWGGAVEGDRLFIGTADLLTPTPGGMHAFGQACSAGQGGALTAVPGAVLSAGLDGAPRAYASRGCT